MNHTKDVNIGFGNNHKGTQHSRLHESEEGEGNEYKTSTKINKVFFRW